MEERLKTLEEALLGRAGTGDAPTYTSMHVDIDPPAPPSEAAASDEAKSQALSSSHRSQALSQALSGSQHSRVASEPASEVIQMDRPFAEPLSDIIDVEEADYDRSSTQPSTKPTPTQSPRLQQEGKGLRLCHHTHHQ